MIWQIVKYERGSHHGQPVNGTRGLPLRKLEALAERLTCRGGGRERYQVEDAERPGARAPH